MMKRKWVISVLMGSGCDGAFGRRTADRRCYGDGHERNPDSSGVSRSSEGHKLPSSQGDHSPRRQVGQCSARFGRQSEADGFRLQRKYRRRRETANDGWDAVLDGAGSRHPEEVRQESGYLVPGYHGDRDDRRRAAIFKRAVAESSLSDCCDRPPTDQTMGPAISGATGEPNVRHLSNSKDEWAPLVIQFLSPS